MVSCFFCLCFLFVLCFFFFAFLSSLLFVSIPSLSSAALLFYYRATISCASLVAGLSTPSQNHFVFRESVTQWSWMKKKKQTQIKNRRNTYHTATSSSYVSPFYLLCALVKLAATPSCTYLNLRWQIPCKINIRHVIYLVHSTIFPLVWRPSHKNVKTNPSGRQLKNKGQKSQYSFLHVSSLLLYFFFPFQSTFLSNKKTAKKQ